MIPAFDVMPLLAGMLIFARMGALLMALPATGSSTVPSMVRLAAALPLAAVLYPMAEGAALPQTLPDLFVAVVGEVIMGLGMGFVVALFTGAVSLAAEVIAMKIGLGMAGMLDPLTGTQGSPLASLAQTLATAIFFGLDLHLGCVSVLGQSLLLVPPGHVSAPFAGGVVIFEVASQVLALGAQLAAPVVFFAFLSNLALMALGRMAPGLQLFFSVGTSFSMVAGILVLSAALPPILALEAAAMKGSFEPMLRFVMELGGG